MRRHQRTLRRVEVTLDQLAQLSDNAMLTLKSQAILLNQAVEDELREGRAAGHQFLDRGRPPFPHKGIGVVPGRQQSHPGIDPLSQKKRN